ncbi:MAG: amidohydrolase family protein [Ardenticatenaceae bacterium]|nr:amidohydrolase family protein [Ardenticatenaceae bacterium]HBY96058.1 hypothetical protein [Chloroflexota bacterium]
MKALKANRLINGNGNGVLEDAVVLVDGEKIVAVESANKLRIPPDAEVIDLGDRTLLPGLIDAHVHFSPEEAGHLYGRMFEPSQRKLIRATVDARNALAAGFTTMRDVGGRDAIYLRDAIAAGDIPGPRILASGLLITSTGGHEDPRYLTPDWVRQISHLSRVASGPDDCREAVREQYRLGADLIKIMSTGLGMLAQFTYKETEALIDEAHKLGMRVASHANGGPGLKDALKAGVDTIEHGTHLDEEDLAFMRAHNIFLCPTLAITEKLIGEGPKYGVAQYMVNAARDREDSRIQSFMKAYRSGVKITTGSDFGLRPFTRHGDNVLELVLMVKAGCAPMDAIVAATKNGAEALGLGDRLGQVQAGKVADLIATRGDPTDRIEDLYQVDFVMKTGAVFRQPASEDRHAGSSE